MDPRDARASKNRGKIAMPIVMRELQYILFVKNQVEVVIVDIILQTLGLRFDILCKIRVL